MTARILPLSLLAALSLAAGAGAGTQNVQFSRDLPDLDRWNYPFNASPGVRDRASLFGAVGFGFLDNHDAQTLVGFLTDQASGSGAGTIASGLGEARYQIVSVTLELSISDGDAFVFDSDYDSFQTYLDPADPDFVADADAGRPIMLFGTGYRNGFGIQPGQIPFEETTPYSFGDPAQPRVRNAYASDFLGGSPRDISNNVTDRFEAVPFAIGQIIDPTGTPLADGDLVPAESTVAFDLDLSNPDVVAFLRTALDAGNLQLSVTGLHSASGGPDGGDGITFPRFFTKEDSLAATFGQTARLDLEVNILPTADLDGDGSVGSGDLAILLGQWGGPGSGDLDGDGVVGSGDLAILLGAWG